MLIVFCRRDNREGIGELINREFKVFFGRPGPGLWLPVQIPTDFQEQFLNPRDFQGVMHLLLFPVTGENAGIGQRAKMAGCV